MHVLVTCKYKKIVSKTTEKRWRHHRFLHYKSMGAFCCHENHCFDPICPKTSCSVFPTPVMLHIKFDQDWPTGFRDIQVWKCGQWWTDDGRTDNGRTTDHKLTLWAFSSGELKIHERLNMQIRQASCQLGIWAFVSNELFMQVIYVKINLVVFQKSTNHVPALFGPSYQPVALSRWWKMMETERRVW